MRQNVNGKVPVHVFTDEDVAFGTTLVQVMAEQPGRLNLSDAAQLAHERMPGHDVPLMEIPISDGTGLRTSK